MVDKEIPAHMRYLAEQVYLLRHQRRWSQAMLAAKAGMSPTTLSNIEQAKMPTITVEHLVALAEVLEATPNDLLGVGNTHGKRKRHSREDTPEPAETVEV